MSLRVSLFATALRYRARRAAASSLRRMRRLGQLAEAPLLTGVPHLEIRGSIRIGRQFHLISEPIPTHLVVHRGAHLEIGDRVTVGSGSGIACHSLVLIGADTRIGDFVMILDSDFHVAGDPSADAEPAPIVIGNDVRIGDRVTILRGSRIEDGASVENGSVVSGFVPAGTRVGGVPAREMAGRVAIDQAASLDARVLSVARHVFRLPELPKLSDGPDDIARWDSLGGLSFMLELEAVFSINLNVDETTAVASLSDVASLVRRASEARDIPTDARLKAAAG